MSAYLADYFSMALQRKKMGIEPLALNAEQTASLCELIKQPPVDADFDLLDLLANRVNPGVDPASKVKADFLYEIALGKAISPILDSKNAVEMLGQMKGGYNVKYLVDLLDDNDLALYAQNALENTLLVYSAFDDILNKNHH